MNSYAKVSGLTRDTIDRIRSAYCEFGCNRFEQPREEVLEWMEASLGPWDGRNVRPYCFPICDHALALNIGGIDEFRMFGSELFLSFNRSSFQATLLAKGILTVGKNASGDHIGIDTKSKNGWRVCAIDGANYMGVYQWPKFDDYRKDSGMDYDAFLNSFRERPRRLW